MNALVVSFCNGSTDGAMLAVRAPSGEWQPIYLPGSDSASACGLAGAGTNVYCAYTRDDVSYLAVCDPERRKVVESMLLPGVRDAHSLVLDGDTVVVASTGNDAVVRVRLADASYEVLWQASSAAADTHHLNGVLMHEGRLLCTAFGPRLGPSWADAVDGYIYDISNNVYVARGLYQPHSLATHGGELYFCESPRGAVRSLRGDLHFVAGYARGLALRADGAFAAGCSVARRAHGHPAAPFRNPADDGARAGTCGVDFGTLTDCTFSHESLAHLGTEIYDILAIG